MKDLRQITGFENYSISSDGDVINNKTGRTLRKFKDSNGYFQVKLYKDNKGISKSVHRIVAKHFVEKYDPTKDVNHKDGNKENNLPENLEWITHKENVDHSIATGLRQDRGENSSKTILKNDQVREIKKMIKSMGNKDISAITGVSTTIIADIRRGKTWVHIN